MTAKDKAKELVEKFDESLNHLTSGTSGIEKYIYERAVSCSLIVVDEVIKAYEYFDEKVIKRKEEYRPLTEYDFWQQVKEEINKL